jgi:hypothetical protein
MKSTYRHLTFAVLILLTIQGCNKTSQHAEPNAKHVIVIGVDGLSPNGILNAHAPVMNSMTENGAWAYHTRSVMPSSSGANWGSMLMGAGPEQHGIISNDWRTDNLVLPPIVVRDDNKFPTIFGIIRDQLPDAELGAILHWNPISNYIEEGVTSYMALPKSERETTDLSVEYIKNEKPLFTFIHLDHVDGAGHGFGHGTQEYYLAVSRADSLIGEIIQATKDAGIFEETVFIVSSDHGGLGTGHGGNTLAEMEIPFIVYGKNVKKNHAISIPVFGYDVPATALFALGIEQPYEWIARPIRSVFEGNEQPKLHYKMNTFLSAPIITPMGEGAPNPYGGLFVGEYPEVSIQNVSDRGDIRYTVDGSAPTPASMIYENPFIVSSNTVVKARIFDQQLPISETVSAYFRVVDNPDQLGIRYETYLVGEIDSLPDFSQLTPESDGISLEISSNNLNLPRESFVAAVFEGQIQIPNDGTYTFYLASDDGSKMYINDKLVINNDGDHGVVLKSDTVDLTSGSHKIRVEWFNLGGGYWLGTMIEGPGIPKQIIPPSMLQL